MSQTVWHLPSIVAFGAWLSLWSTPVLACACCADEGHRTVDTFDAAPGYIAELATLRTVGATALFVSPCDLDCVQGIDAPNYTYDLALEITQAAITLRTLEGTSRLSIPMSATYEAFSVDIEPTQPDRTTVILFSEHRFTGTLSATGVFAPSNGAMGRFILSGWTNHCALVSEFTQWSLDVQGDGVDFRLFGKIKTE